MRRGIVILFLLLSTTAYAEKILITYERVECTKQEKAEKILNYVSCIVSEPTAKDIIDMSMRKISAENNIPLSTGAMLAFWMLADGAPKTILTNDQLKSLKSTGTRCERENPKAKYCSRLVKELNVEDYWQLPEDTAYYTYKLCEEATLQEEITLCNEGK